jgi:hypothetical protein
MPVTKTITLYTFEELPDEEAKEKARQWWRDASAHDEFWDATYEDADAIAGLMGIEIDRAKNGPGYVGPAPAIQFSGFWSQGDGASFTGKWRSTPDAVAKVKDYAPKDEKLHAIAQELQDAGPNLLATITRDRGGNYSHENTVSIDVETVDPETEDADAAPKDKAEAVAEALRDFMRWIYRQLEAEHTYQNADEQVDEMLVSNGYHFTATGKRCDP